MGTFADQVAAFEAKATKRTLAVFHGSAQDLAEATCLPLSKGGFMHVLTSFLRNSLQASTSAMPSINPNARPPENAAPGSFGDNLGQINLVIAGAKLGETLYLGYTAAYAAYRERQDGFVRLPAQRWDDIVYNNVLKSYQAFP